MIFKIAIDGPAGAGKTTIAKILAKRMDMEYLDTGAMYRAITLKALRLKIDLNEEENYEFVKTTIIDFQKGKLIMDGNDVTKEIRTLEVTNNVSLVCSFKIVREQLVMAQRKMSESKSVVMDGRDIGTVVLPDADLKVFLIADSVVRAKRRRLERIEEGINTETLEETVEEINIRDYKDSTRKISPLRKADDAIEVDTTDMDIDTVVDKIISLARGRGFKMEEVKNTEELTKDEEQNSQIIENSKEKEVAVEAAPVKEEGKKEQQETANVSKKSSDEASKEEKSDNSDAEVEKKTNEEETKAEEKNEEEKAEVEAPKIKELELVEGTVERIISPRPEKTDHEGQVYRKAKKGRVLVKLDSGLEGFLFARDVPDDAVQSDEDLFDEFIEGDRVRLIVKKVYEDGGKVLLSAKLVEKREQLSDFEDKIKNHEIFKAKVIKQIAVGLILEYDGYSCLLPTSQIDVPEAEVAGLVGQEIEVAPIRVDYNRIRLIVSQRVGNAIEHRKQRQEFLETVKVGDVFEGIVKNIESYGAFVEITPGVEGLLHISEVEHNRIVKIEKVLNVGDKTKVQVIRVDENGHIGLSRKALIPNVWKDYIDSVEVEQIVKGTVDSINRAGIVINLNEQIQAFLPKSEFSWDRNVYLEDYVKEGDEMEAKIIELDLNKKRVILSKKRLSPNPWETLEIKPEDMLDCKVIKVLDDGIRFSTNGITGYLPSSNYGDRQGFKVGEEFKARVRLFDSEKDKLFVTLRAQRASSSTYTTSRKSSGADKEVNKYLKNQEEISNTFGDFINLDDYK